MSRLTPRAGQQYAEMGDAVEEAQNHILGIQRRIGEIERQIRHKSPTSQAEEIAVYEDELDRQRTRVGRAQHAFTALSRLHTAINTWLLQLAPHVELEDVEVESAELERGEDYTEAALRVRADIEELVAARSAIRRAVPPLQDLWAQADAHVDALAARGRPTFRIDGDKLVVRHVFEGQSERPLVLLAWLHPDQMKERLRADIGTQRERELHGGMIVMSAAERAEKVRSLDDLVLAKEREEESIIRDAEQSNTTIPRREQASPLAILGLRIARRARVSSAA